MFSSAGVEATALETTWEGKAVTGNSSGACATWQSLWMTVLTGRNSPRVRSDFADGEHIYRHSDVTFQRQHIPLVALWVGWHRAAALPGCGCSGIPHRERSAGCSVACPRTRRGGCSATGGYTSACPAAVVGGFGCRCYWYLRIGEGVQMGRSPGQRTGFSGTHNVKTLGVFPLAILEKKAEIHLRHGGKK